MNQVLRIDASMRAGESHSRQLVNYLLARFDAQATHIQHRDLSDHLPLLNQAWIEANFTDAAQRSTEQQSVLALSDALVEELRQADTIVVASPIYNFQIPAAFKAWIDLVARAKQTFHYTPNGPKGLLQNKRAFIVITSGGTKLGSDIDFVSGYLRHVFAFIGITDLTLIDASGIGRDQEAVLAQARHQIDELIFQV